MIAAQQQPQPAQQPAGSAPAAVGDLLDKVEPGPLTLLLWSMYSAEYGLAEGFVALQDLVKTARMYSFSWLPLAETALCRALANDTISEDDLADMCHDLAQKIRTFDMHEVPNVLRRYFPDL
jgi:hypothetical protein